MNDQSLKAAATQTLPPEVHEGALLAGRYRMGRLLGSGGMGAVLAAEHVELNEPVAIKVLLRDAAAQASPEALGRFTREAWAASKIKSEYVARVNDLGKLEDGTPYIVMEYLDGIDLEGLLLEHATLELEQALELMLQACEALAEAHALGIFHRDLKPSNLFCIRRSDGLLAIKLLDFGISKISPAADSFADPRLTGTASTLGTPLYMSPEQLRSGRVADERSDIWSLGVILYEMLLGHVPFTADNLADLAVRIATEKPASIAQARAEVPAALERVVMRCLEKDSARRFQSVAELAHALAEFGPPRAAAHAERAERILLAKSARSMPLVSTTRSTLSSAGSHARLRTNNANTLSVRKPKQQTIAIALGLALLLAVVAFAALRRGTSPASSSTKPALPAQAHETRSSAASALPSAAPSRSAVPDVAEPHSATPAAARPPSASEADRTKLAADPTAATGITVPGTTLARKQQSDAPAQRQSAAATRAPHATSNQAAAPAPSATGERATKSAPPPSAARDRASKQQRPGKAASPAKDSELDSLGGRL